MIIAHLTCLAISHIEPN